MTNWKNLFYKRILERGEDYYEEGLVTDVTKTSSGYHALVEGSEVYEVEIEMDDGEIYDLSCDCPFADGGNYCKHMAAVLYYLDTENEEDEQKEPDMSWMERIAIQNKELDDVISHIPEEEIRKFVKRLASEDSEIRNWLMTSYSQKIDAQQVKLLHEEVDDIVYRYSGRHRFIDYVHAWNFTSDLESFLYDKVQILINRNCHMQAFDLTNYVFKIIGNIDMDDSDGGSTQVANACYEMWVQVLKKCNEEEKKKLFTWFQEHSTGGYVIDFMEDYLLDFLMNEFHDRELLQKKLEMVDQDIARMSDSTDCGNTWSVHYGYQNNIVKRLDLMKELEYSEEEMKQYRKENWRFAAVRKLEIADLLEKGDIIQAITVLKESKELDKQYAGLVAEYSQQLIQIYKQELMQEEYKQELLSYVFSHMYTDITYALELKAICSEEEWVEQRTQLLKKIKGSPCAYQLMEAEGLYEEMLQGISQEVHNSGWISRMDEYEKILKAKFPEKVRDIYVSYVRQVAGRTSSRNQYRSLTDYLRKIKKYPDGKEIAADIAKDWRAMYSRRSAMMDEIRKAGF